jgi:hypothetical protein
MPSAPRPIQTLVDTLLAVKKHGGVATAARKLGVKYSGFQSRHRDALAAHQGGSAQMAEERHDRADRQRTDATGRVARARRAPPQSARGRQTVPQGV